MSSSTAMQSSQPPKGTRDFFPGDMRVLRYLFSTWERVCRSFAFEEYEGPTFEALELYTGKSGPEIVTQLYNFTDKGGREISLRPELTPTLARMINQKGASLRLPVKWFSIPRLYRYEKSQRGRLREFYQLNMDVIGCENIWAEVDLVVAIVEMLKAFGLKSGDFSVKISSRKLLSAFLDSLGVDVRKKPLIYAALDKKAKLPQEEFRRQLDQAGLAPKNMEQLEGFFQCSSLEKMALFRHFEGTDESAQEPQRGSEALTSAFSELETLFSALGELGYADYMELDLSVVRGLAYYTGIVFEVYDKGINLRALAGGGRYDNLLENLGGRPVTGVGFGMGDVVLAELLKEKGLLPSFGERVDYFLLSFGGLSAGLLQLARELRSKGLQVAYSLSGGKMKKQMEVADEVGARRVVFFGSDKAPPGQFEVKDLSSGEQFLVRAEDL